MARPTLRQHRKFRALSRRLASPALAWGSLELLWHVAYDQSDDIIGSEVDVEEAMCWRGKPGLGCAALVAAGFVDATPDGYRVHDLWDHCPDYVQKRAKREASRKDRDRPPVRTNGGQVSGQTADTRTPSVQTNAGTPAPAPAPAPSTLLPAHTPAPRRDTSPAPEEWCADDLWQLWREAGDEHQCPQPITAGPKVYEHLKRLMESYTETQLRAALAAWWDSPHTGGRNLGLFLAQVGEVLEHLSKSPGAVFRAPAAKSAGPQFSPEEWAANRAAKRAMR